MSIFIPKVKLTCIATEIQLPYPEWIATCIQLKSLETYLLLLNRNLTKCKDRFELRKEKRPLSYTRMRELFIDAFLPFVSDIKKYGLHSLRPGGVTTAPNYAISNSLQKANTFKTIH